MIDLGSNRFSGASRSKTRVTGVLLLVFVFGVLQADLKVAISSYVHWLLAIPLLLSILLVNLRMKWRVNVPFHFILLVLPTTMIFNFLVTNGRWYDVGQSAKVLVIFLSALIIYNLVGSSDFLRTALIASTIVNALLLIFAVLFALPTAEVMTSDGRWGNVLNYPGSLAKVGILTLGYSLYGLIAIQRDRLKYVCLTLLSAFIIFMDGSRTAFLGSLISLCFIGLIILIEYVRKSSFASLGRLIRIGLMLAVLTALFYSFGGGIAERTIDFLKNVFSNDASDGLQRSDSTRYVMLQAVFYAIAQHPIFGTGMGSTVAGVVGAEGMTIHLSYLQLWADAGLFPFLSFVAICLFGISIAVTAIYRAMSIENDRERAFIYGMAAVIVYFIFNGFFHPFSTEWSEWIIFIAPMCVLLNFIQGERVSR